METDKEHNQSRRTGGSLDNEAPVHNSQQSPFQKHRSQTLSEVGSTKLMEMRSKQEGMVEDMVVLCKTNDLKFQELLEKKRAAKAVDEQMNSLAREYLLMEKQVEFKEKKAKALERKNSEIRKIQEVKQKRRQVKENFMTEKQLMEAQLRQDGKKFRYDTDRAKFLKMRSIYLEKKKLVKKLKPKLNVL